jgi:porin
MASLNANLSTEKAGLWRHGTLAVSAVHTHGATPSSELFGDAHISSNIEAGNRTFLMELWISQQFGPVELTAGLQDLNSVFAFSKSGGLYLNSSFGINPVISGNIPAPIFPLTAPGLTVIWQMTGAGSIGAALFDGRPVPFEENPYNIRWRFNRGDGLLALLEYRHTATVNGLGGEYRFGLFSHNHMVERIINPDLSDMPCRPTLGGYAIADQQLWVSGSREARLFVQAGYSPSSESYVDLSGALGFNIKGLIRSRGDDLAGMAITTGRFTGGAGSETVIEVTYKAHINGNIFLQPDLQYIINPSGKESMTPHCLACFLRLGIII